MRTGHRLILATKPYAQDHTAKSWWCVLSTLVLLVGAMSGTFWSIHPAGKVVCSVLSGLLLLRFFVIYHDQQHHAILPRSRAAEWLMQAFGIFSISPSSIWRESHNHHHNHNSQLRGSHIGSYPIMTSRQYLKSSPSVRFKYLAVRHPLTIACGYLTVFLFGMCLNPLRNRPKKHLDCLLALVLHFAIAVVLLAGWGWQQLLLTQTIPYFIGSAIGSYLFYAQHNFPGVCFNDKLGWTYEKAALESSSFMRANPVIAWFTANIGFHHIHHLNSRIPFYRLPEAFREMPELQLAKTTSLHPADIYRCLRLKVWDVESQRMIGLAELRKSAAARRRADGRRDDVQPLAERPEAAS